MKLLHTIGLLLFSSFSLFSQNQPNKALLESCRREVAAINDMVLSRAYILTPGDPDVVLVGKLAAVDYPQWRPRVYFDSAGKVRKFIETGEYGNVNISYYDRAGYLRYMVSSDYREGKEGSAIIYANRNKVVSADLDGKEMQEVEMMTHVDSIAKRYEVKLVTADDFPKMGFKLGTGTEYIRLNRGELIEPVEYLYPTAWQVTYFGTPDTPFIPDEQKMEHNRQSTDGINALPLKKFYLLNDSIAAVQPSWQLLTSPLEQEILAKAERANYVYIDSHSKIRKYVRRAAPHKDNTWNLIAYYDEQGDLLKLLCHNVYYDTIYCNKNGLREVYDIKTSSVFGSIFRQSGELIMQGYTQADFCDTKHPLKYQGIGSELLPAIGKVDVSPLFHADSLASSLKLHIQDFILESGLEVCFSKDSLRNFTMTSIPHVPLRMAPSMTARIETTLDAGLDTYVIERAFDEFTREYGVFPWYKVYFDSSTNYDAGYIYGVYLEPEEIQFTP